MHPYISNIRGFEWNFRPFIKILIWYGNLLAAILESVNLTMSEQYFSLETVISEIYAKFPIKMMLQILLMMSTSALVYHNGVSTINVYLL